NPAAYLPNLAGSLNNLANRLAETGDHQAALTAYTDTIEALQEHPEAAAAISCDLASFEVRQPDPQPGLRRLIELTSAEPQGRTTARARHLLRTHAQADPDAHRTVSALWQETQQSPVPDWLGIPPALISLVWEWLNCSTWSDSQHFLEQHSEELLSDTARLTLEELSLRTSVAKSHAEIAAQAQSIGAAAALRPYLLGELLGEWFACPTWEESQSFLEAHAEDLLADETVALLADLTPDPDPEVLVHRAVLGLASSDGVTPAFRLLEDRQALHARVQTALRDLNGPDLSSCALLEATVYADDLAALTHLHLAHILDSAPDDPDGEDDAETATPDPGLTDLLAPADPADRNRLAAEITALIRRAPHHAPALSTLLQHFFATP
ncbi:hypothetical protein U9R90_36240, partial [Streptomyces sp. E11-3]